ncbi:MAG: LSU ribosomal protein L20p, partial [uncultured Nocardioides sp.]
GTRQAGGQRPQEAPGRPRAGRRLPRSAFAPVPQGQGAGHPLAGLQLQRPPQEQGQLPQAVDPADQRRRPCAGDDLQPLHPGPEPRRHRGRPQDPGRARRQRRRRVQRPRRGGQGRPARRRQRPPGRGRRL